MSDKYGLLIAEDGESIKSARNKVDSRRPRWICDLEADPRHMDIFEGSAGTGYNALLTKQQETLFSMKHKLGYTPVVLAYFYIVSDAGSTNSGAAGRYSGEFYPLSGSAGTINDMLTYEVDKDEFRIVHFTIAYLSAELGYVSAAPKYQIRVKFYIMSIDSGLTTYTGLDNFI